MLQKKSKWHKIFLMWFCPDLLGAIPREWNTLDQIKKYKHNLTYTKKDIFFTLATIMFVVMLLTVLRASVVLLDSLTLELPSELQSNLSGSYMFDMLSSSSQRTINKRFFLLKNTYAFIRYTIALTQGTLTK